MKSTGVIAFCGSKGSGKSTSYQLFKEFYQGETEEIAIAGHLKDVCSKVFQVEMKHFTEPSLKEVEFDGYRILTRTNIEAVYKAFDLDNIDFDTQVRPFMGKVLETPRKLLQYIGTELLHPIDPLIHIKVALAKKDLTKLTVVTDLRFLAEFNYFGETLNADFTPVYIKRSSAEAQAA